MHAWRPDIWRGYCTGRLQAPWHRSHTARLFIHLQPPLSSIEQPLPAASRPPGSGYPRRRRAV